MTETTTATTGSVAQALGDVERWFEGEESRHQSEILEVDQEIKNLEAAIANLQTQLDALHRYRSELGAKVRTLGAEHVSRAYRSVFETLKAQRIALDQREAALLELDRARREALPAKIASGEIGALVEEYRQFKATVEPTLKALPDSYRSVILKHHQGVTDRLRDWLAAGLGVPLALEGDEVPVEVVYAIDAPEGEPELLVVVLPVPEEVHASWTDRPDGLTLWVAARVVQAVYETAAAAGFARAQVVAGGHEGLLVIEVDLEGCDGAFVDALEQQLATVFAHAPELGGAKLKIAPRKVHIDYVVPPETVADDREVGDA